tara:strand:- start:14755 stop:16167 length:1413 start_codon:yes stop_codon:yes gene_type:complete
MQKRNLVKAMSAVFLTLTLGACSDTNTDTDSASVETSTATVELTHPLDKVFTRYTEYNPSVPIWNVTPDIDRCIHRFHLSSPFSPSGRYLGLTCLQREDKEPQPGDVARVVVVDLETGEQKIVAQTIGWDTQLGAQVQWGSTDQELYFNDVNPETWMPFAVKMNHLSGEKQKLDGAIYDISPDGKWGVRTSLRRIGATQAGYGVIVPKEYVPVNKGFVDDDGVYVVNTTTGESKMVVSYKTIVEQALPKIDVSRYGAGDFYGFHTKFNAKSDRIMLVLRYMPYNEKQRKPMLITMTRTGEDIHVAIDASEWADKGGNHPNWHPDGEHVMMNLDIDKVDLDSDEENWKYVQARYDGKDLRTFTTVPANHGHPAIHPDGRYMISDVYPREADAFGDGTVPLHFVDLENHQRQTLVRMDAVTTFFDADFNKAKAMRVDLHPAWDRSNYTRVAINGVVDGTRRVFVADLSGVLK